MIFNKLFKVVVVLSFCMASVNLSSCTKDNNDDNNNLPEYPAVPTDCKPGDDFYHYVNAEWFKSLDGIVSQEWYGTFNNIANESKAKVQTVKYTMPEIKALEKAGANREKNYEASLQLAEDIVQNLLAEAETKEDAYVVFGKAIRLGVSSIATIHTGICHEDNTIGFYFVPPTSDMTSVSGVHRPAETNHHVVSKYFSRYVQNTRSEKSPLDYVLEGIGLDPKHYLSNEVSELINTALEETDRRELLTNVGEALLTHLYCYCSDDYARQCTNGEVNSVEEYVNLSLDNDLGYFTSYYFSQTYPTDSVEPAFKALGDELIASFRKRMEENQWLSPETKQAAIEKLDNMGKHYGTPKKWPTTEMLQLSGEMLLNDIMEIQERRINIIESLLGKSMNEYLPIYYMFYNPVESIFTYTPNAFYDPGFNAFYVLPSFMLEPAYSSNMDECKLYATWGVVIGHEITHGFDKEGALYDKNGVPNNWWTESDAAKFAELNALRMENISSYEILPNMQAYSERTITEDVADLGGFNIAYDLWVNKLKERGVEGDELKEMKKQFFINYGTLFCEKIPVNDMIERAEQDTHSPGHIRINSVVQHIDDWYELFDVTEGDALYLAPEDRITIW